MSSDHSSEIVIELTAVGLAAWEIFAIMTNRQTISRGFEYLFDRYPFGALVIGGILGHCLWRLDPDPNNKDEK